MKTMVYQGEVEGICGTFDTVDVFTLSKYSGDLAIGKDISFRGEI